MLDTKRRVNILLDIVNTGFICGGGSDTACAVYNRKPRKAAFHRENLHDRKKHQKHHEMKRDDSERSREKGLDSSNNRSSEVLIFRLEEELKENEQLMNVIKKEKRVKFHDTTDIFYYDKSTKEENEERWYKSSDYKDFKINGLQSIYEIFHASVNSNCNNENQNSSNNNKISLDMQLLKKSNGTYCVRGLERYITTSANGKIAILDHDATSKSRKLYVQNILKLQANHHLIASVRTLEHQGLQKQRFDYYDSHLYYPMNGDEDVANRFSVAASTHSRRDRLLAKRRASQDERDALELHKQYEEKS